MIDPQIIDEFKQITNVNLTSFFEEYKDYFSNNRNLLIKYYSGKSNGKIPELALKKLDTLIASIKSILEKIEESSYRLNNYKFWELMDFMEDINSYLLIDNSLGRWLKSVPGTYAYFGGVEKLINLKQNQNLEKLTNELGFDDYNDRWANLAINNQLREEDYDIDGGNELKVLFEEGEKYDIKSVVDFLVGKNIYGKDFPKEFLVIDNEDFDVLVPEDTINQSAIILLDIKKGDIPEFLEIGIQSNLVVGQTVGTLILPVLLKELVQTFQEDDSFSEILVTKIELVKDAVKLECTITTVYGESIYNVAVL